MPRKRNHADSSPIKELGEFEFDDVSVSKTGKIVERKRKCQLEFPCFKSFPVGQREGESSSFVQAPSVSQASQIDNLESVSDVDDAEDVNVMDKYNKRRLSLLTSWERQQRNLLKAHSDHCCIPKHTLCNSCCETSPEYRCRDCGLDVYYCLNCLVESHRTNNQLHIPEKFQVLAQTAE